MASPGVLTNQRHKDLQHWDMKWNKKTYAISLHNKFVVELYGNVTFICLWNSPQNLRLSLYRQSETHQKNNLLWWRWMSEVWMSYSSQTWFSLNATRQGLTAIIKGAASLFNRQIIYLPVTTIVRTSSSPITQSEGLSCQGQVFFEWKTIVKLVRGKQIDKWSIGSCRVSWGWH